MTFGLISFVPPGSADRPHGCNSEHTASTRAVAGAEQSAMVGLDYQIFFKCSKLRYQQLEGTLNELCEHNLPPGETREQLLNERGNSVSFWQADYSNLRPQLDGYQVIVADFRHKDAAQHLFHLSTKLKAGGLLLLGSIDDVSGNDPAGPLSSLVVLGRLFTRVHCDGALESYPHIYKETRNKHQYAISYFSAWRKKEDAESIQLTAEEEVIYKFFKILYLMSFESGETDPLQHNNGPVLRGQEHPHLLRQIPLWAGTPWRQKLPSTHG